MTALPSPCQSPAGCAEYQEPGCDNKTFTLPALSLLNTVHEHLRRELEGSHSPHLEPLAGVSINNMVLLGHSLGGLVAIQGLTGEGSMP